MAVNIFNVRKLVTAIAIDICNIRMQFFSKENNLIVPGTTLGEMVPDLIAFG